MAKAIDPNIKDSIAADANPNKIFWNLLPLVSFKHNGIVRRGVANAENQII